MSRIRPDQPLVPSVLDRLIDEHPELTREPPGSQGQADAELRRCVRRDVENLLNTRCRCRSWPAELTELERSVVGYGIPDISAANLANENGRRQFLRLVEQVLRIYEPRFKSVKVRLLDNLAYLDRTLRFRIDAMLYAFPAPEPVVFDSQVNPSTGSFEVQGASR